MKLKLSYQKESKHILQLHEILCDTLPLLASVVEKYYVGVSPLTFTKKFSLTQAHTQILLAVWDGPAAQSYIQLGEHTIQCLTM